MQQRRSSHLNTQLMQRSCAKNLKKIQVIRIRTLTSAILVQRSTQLSKQPNRELVVKSHVITWHSGAKKSYFYIFIGGESGSAEESGGKYLFFCYAYKFNLNLHGATPRKNYRINYKLDVKFPENNIILVITEK